MQQLGMPVAPSRKQTRTLVLVAIGATLIVHAALLTYLVTARHRVMAPRMQTPGSPQGAVAQRLPPARASADQPPIDPEGLRRTFVTTQRQMAAKSKDQQLHELTSRLDQLNAVDPENLSAITRLIESLMIGQGASGSARAFEPGTDVSGAFDTESSYPYAVKTGTDAAGRTVHEWTYLDHAGRTITAHIFDEHLTTSDRVLMQLLQLKRDNPNLVPLLELAWKIAESRQTSDDGAGDRAR
jgi:hypothetical protein